MSATGGLVSRLSSDSTGTRTAVWTELDRTVSEPPAHAKTTSPRLAIVRGGPGVACTWKVTVPDAPLATGPRSTATTPPPAGTTEPASSPTASVSGVPFQRSVPGTYALPTGMVSATSALEALPPPVTT